MYNGLQVPSGEVGVRPTAVMIRCPHKPMSVAASMTSSNVTVFLYKNELVETFIIDNYR